MNDAPRKGDWIQTYTGKKFWPLDPRPEDVCIEDIAHSLSLLCRFTGHVREFYSVAQHSIYCSREAGGALDAPDALTVPVKLRALLHDAAEAYIGDINRPLKQYLYANCTGYDRAGGYASIRGVESFITDAVMKALVPGYAGSVGVGESEKMRKEIHRVDEMLLVSEAADLMGPQVHEWTAGKPRTAYKIEPTRSPVAEREFLRVYAALCDLLKKQQQNDARLKAMIADVADRVKPERDGVSTIYPPLYPYPPAMETSSRATITKLRDACERPDYACERPDAKSCDFPGCGCTPGCGCRYCTNRRNAATFTRPR